MCLMSFPSSLSSLKLGSLLAPKRIHAFHAHLDREPAPGRICPSQHWMGSFKLFVNFQDCKSENILSSHISCITRLLNLLCPVCFSLPGDTSVDVQFPISPRQINLPTGLSLCIALSNPATPTMNRRDLLAQLRGMILLFRAEIAHSLDLVSKPPVSSVALSGQFRDRLNRPNPSSFLLCRYYWYLSAK